MSGESNLWKWLRDLAPRGHFCRVETGDTDPGHPDVYYRLNSLYSGFIELKSNLKKLKVDQIPFKDEDEGLHRSQRIWIKREIELGGVVWILARVGNSVLWIYGSHYDEFNGRTLSELKNIASTYYSTRAPKHTETIQKVLRGQYGKI